MNISKVRGDNQIIWTSKMNFVALLATRIRLERVGSKWPSGSCNTSTPSFLTPPLVICQQKEDKSRRVKPDKQRRKFQRGNLKEMLNHCDVSDEMIDTN
ncbi:hypothetical protein M5689_002505 [Euphorbia peplus]|nr:hypothetical protein M5689_002505 [Euphorbia peplus]